MALAIFCCASEQVDGTRGTTCSSCTLFARPTRSSRLQRGTPSTIFRKPASCRLAGRFGADVSNSYSLPVNILNLAEKILGALDDDQEMALVRFRMMDKNDLESFIRSTASADFLAEARARNKLKSRDAVDEAELPDHIEVKTLFAKLKNHSKAAASSRSSAGAAGAPPAGQVSGHGKATGIVLPPEPKKRRKYPKNIDIGEHVDEAHIDSLLPFSNTIYKDSLDQGWRLNSYGKRFFRSWHLHGKANAAQQLVELAWNRAVTMCYQESCPFDEFKVDASSWTRALSNQSMRIKKCNLKS